LGETDLSGSTVFIARVLGYSSRQRTPECHKNRDYADRCPIGGPHFL